MATSHELARPGYAATGGAEIYYEARGAGPGLVFVPGGGVDASHFAHVAGLLADEFTTVTYDRRGYFRSRTPEGWTGTTVAEQADDLAGLIEALDLAPVAVWGGSLGGIILLDLLIRRPSLLREAYIHEPPLFAVLPDAPPPSPAGDLGDPRAAMEAHSRDALGQAFDRLGQHERVRLLANGQVFLGVDAPGCSASTPDPDSLASGLAGAAVPVHVLADPGDPVHPLRRISQWVADQAGVTLRDLPGGHMPYSVEPVATARALRSLSRNSRPADL